MNATPTHLHWNWKLYLILLYSELAGSLFLIYTNLKEEEGTTVQSQ